MKSFLVAGVYLSLAATVSSLAGFRELPVWGERLGWTLVHSCWQLVIVAMIAVAADVCLRRRSANARYVASVIAMALMLVVPCFTWFVIPVPARSSQAEQYPLLIVETNDTEVPRLDDVDSMIHADGETLPVPNPKSMLSAEIRIVSPGGEANSLVSVPIPVSANTQPAGSNSASVGRATFSERVRLAIVPWLGTIITIWLAGVVLLSIRPVWGLWTQFRLRRIGLSNVPDELRVLMLRLASQMGLSPVVRIAVSTLVKVPMVVGYLRPMILVPASVITGLTPGELESLLAHELAHIRRHDWIVNAMQVVIETLLFYHPAVWWLSNRIRHERELCCDDIALAVIGDKAKYGRMLLALEELLHHSPSPALAATGGNLVYRIRRLLPTDRASHPDVRNWRAGFLLLAVMGCAGGITLLAMPPERKAQNETQITDSRQPTERNDDSNEANPPAATESPAVARDIDGPDEKPPATADSNDIPPFKSAEAKEGPSPERKTDQPRRRGILWLLGLEKGEETSKAEKRVVRVVDEQGNPVKDARVQFDFQTELHAYQIVGPFMTNAKGEARAEIPEGAGNVNLNVTANGFNKFATEELATGTSTVTLTRGNIVRVRPVDEKKQLLKDAVPLLAGTNTWGREFNFINNQGIYESPTVEGKRKLLRVACSQADGPFLFSDLIDVTKTKPGDDGVFELTLKPGVRLHGRLDDSVPRPITQGYAVVTIVEGDDGTIAKGKQLDWQDFTPVRPDGTFTFESLPGGGHAQLHVMVDGFLSKNWSAAEIVDYMRRWKLADDKYLAETLEWVHGFDIRPQFIALDRPTVEATIACEPAAACDFQLLDPGMKPVAEASISCNPNVVFAAQGSQLPGYQLWTSLMVDGLRTGNTMFPLTRTDKSPHGQDATKFYQWIQHSFLRTTSDEAGRVKIRNLPGGSTQTFHISAKGYVLPVSPLVDDEDQPFGPDSDTNRNRYLRVEMTAGETVEKTIYLEREQRVTERELTVVDKTGRPIPHVSLAVAEISVGKKGWQTWSVQRFGPLPKGVTDRLGRLVLKIPSDVENVPVTRVRLGVNYRGSQHRERRVAADDDDDDDRRKTRYKDELFIAGASVDIPLRSDNGVIALLTDPDHPNTPIATYQGVVRYGLLEAIVPGQTKAEWLEKMAKEPSMAVLRGLLAGTKMKYPEPVDLLSETRRMAMTPGSKESGGVEVVTTADDTFTIVETHVKPKNSDLVHDSRLSPLPECAFVFDKQGDLIAVVGGEFGRTGSNSPDSVEVLSLGPGEDWFIRASRYENNRGFDHITTYYRVANPMIPSFRIYHLSHSGSWSWGPQKTARYGFLGYDFPSAREEDQRHQDLATSPRGGKAVSGFVWDGDRNRFIGPAASILRSKPIYEVDTEFSKEFEPLVPTSDQLAVWGGEYDYGNIWELVVPEGTELIARLTFPDTEGQQQVIERRLNSGRRELQLYFKPREGDDQKLQLEFRVNGRGPSEELEKLFKVPGEIGPPPENKLPVFRIVEPNVNVILLDRSLKSVPGTVKLELQFRKPAQN